jgi:hypothetical protein
MRKEEKIGAQRHVDRDRGADATDRQRRESCAKGEKSVQVKAHAKVKRCCTNFELKRRRNAWITRTQRRIMCIKHKKKKHVENGVDLALLTLDDGFTRGTYPSSEEEQN